MKKLYLFLAGIFTGLLAAGLILLAAGQPRGSAVELPPLPSPAPLLVFVSGGVANPGTYALPPGSRAGDAVEAAGGFAPEADRQAVNLAAMLKDGQQVAVPLLKPGLDPAIPPGAAALVNINTATLEELDSLPGIGPATAQAILDYRERLGPFDSVDDLEFVDGIGPATLEAIRLLITID